MRRLLSLRHGLLFAVVAVMATSVSNVQAQLANGNLWSHPQLNVLTPTGGRVGSTVEVVVAGTEIEDTETLHFSHPGLKATLVGPAEPPPDVKGKETKGKEAKKIERNKFAVAIAGDVPPGSYDVRLVTKYGVSNPRVFVVGTLNDIAEKEPNNDVEQAQRVEIGTTINGVIASPTDVDYSIFTGKKGQRVLIYCQSASIDSKLNPEIRLFDAAGQQLGHERGLPNQDGMLDVTLPADADYTVRLNQFTYTGAAADYFYRLTISTGPWLDAIFPPVVEPGKATPITLYGRNLPGGQPDPQAMVDGKVLEKLTVTVNAPPQGDRLHVLGLVGPVAATIDGFDYRFVGPTGTSNPRLIGFAQAPVVIENDDNDTPEKAQQVNVPCEIAGKVDKKRDRDWYTFTAKKGDILTIDVASQRLGAPTDMYVSLRKLDKKQEIVLMEDTELPISNRFYTSTQDPTPYRFVVPEDGAYHLLAASHTGDTQADPQHVYRIRIAPEKPDFRVFVMPGDDHRPDAVTLGQNGERYFQVFIARHDGFKGDVTLTMDSPPPGVTCPPQTFSNGVKFGLLSVSANDGAAPFVGAVKIVGTADIKGQKVVHEARPATMVWPIQANQNTPTVTRLDRETILAVRDKSPGRLTAAKDKATVKLGEKVEIPLKLQRISPEFKAPFQVQAAAGPASELPPNFTFANLTFAPDKNEMNAVVTTTAQTIPGTYNVVFRGFAPINSPTSKGKPVNVIINSTPVQVTVLPKEVAKLTIEPAGPNVKAGGETAVTVKVARLYDYADAIKVELVLPPDAKGLSAEGVTIAPGANEGKLTLRVPANTPPANLQNLVIRATAVVYGDVTLTHEAKINVNITK